MNQSVVYLFVDTNLLIQCRPLEELDWSHWKAFDEVRLVVTSPVLREIDYRKNKGNDRTGSRARSASAMLRKMVEDEFKLITEGHPRVTLSVEPHHQYSKALEDRLNYQERDDQLVGTIHRFAEDNPDLEVRLLTHDTMPMYTAKGVGLAVDIIPDSWLLPPEATKSEKEVNALRAENVRLKKAEPAFSIVCIGEGAVECEQYESIYVRFEPLAGADIHRLMQRIRESFPLETDFGSREPAVREAKPLGISAPMHIGRFKLLPRQEEFIPATDKEIEEYRNEAYPGWLEKCERMLSDLHNLLQEDEPLSLMAFVVENVGTRPADDALITIEASGNFKIRPFDSDPKDDDDEGASEDTIHLPRPPAAPRGSWKTIIESQPPGGLGATDLLNRDLYEMSRFGDPHRFGSLGLDHLHSPLPEVRRRDPNGFYYKPARPIEPKDAFSLECAQWRHENGAEYFFAQMHFLIDQERIEGALVCRIQAANMSEAATRRVPVRITIQEESTLRRATELVDELTKGLAAAIDRLGEPTVEERGKVDE